MTQRTASPSKRARPLQPATPPVVWPRGFRVSERGFEMLCRANPDLRLEREANGKVTIMAPANMDSGRKEAEIIIELGIWNREYRMGYVFSASAGFTFTNTAVRAADAAWMARERWDALPLAEKERFSHISPDFVVELRSSKKDNLERLRAKMHEYLAQGVRLGWLIDPQSGKVEIYRPDRPVEILDKPATVSGEEVLPGFVLDLKAILDS